MHRTFIGITIALALVGCALNPGASDLVNDGRNTDNVLT